MQILDRQLGHWPEPCLGHALAECTISMGGHVNTWAFLPDWGAREVLVVSTHSGWPAGREYTMPKNWREWFAAMSRRLPFLDFCDICRECGMQFSWAQIFVVLRIFFHVLLMVDKNIYIFTVQIWCWQNSWIWIFLTTLSTSHRRLPVWFYKIAGGFQAFSYSKSPLYWVFEADYWKDFQH